MLLNGKNTGWKTALRRCVITSGAAIALDMALSALRLAFAFEPGERTKVILFPATISRFQPEKSAHVNGHDADINCVVNSKKDEIVSKNQRNMDQGADSEHQEMGQNLNVRGAPSPKPGCTIIFLEVNRPSASRSLHDFLGAGIRKIPE
jgi:hypothetical protein